MQSVTTAPRGTARDQPGVFPHALASRPCRASNLLHEFASGASGWSNTRPCSSRLALGALRCAGLFACTPRPKPVRVASPAGDRRPGGPCPAAPVTGRGGQPSARPPASDLAAAGPEASPPPHADRGRAACPPGLPQGSGKGRTRPHRLQPCGGRPPARQRRGRMAGGEGDRRGSCCRVPVDVRERVSGETITCEACLRRRSQLRQHHPVGGGRQVRRPPRCMQRRCEHPGDPGRPRISRCGRPSGPSSRGVSPSCVLA